MPRPYWTGQLRLSLVSCPITLSPAINEAEHIRLHQINPETGNRISLQPVDAETREPVERDKLIKGYEIEKGRYVELANEELEALKIESSRVLDLTAFVDRASVEPLYINASYYVHPEKGGEEAYRVIAQAMTGKRKVALGRIVLSTREHPVLVEPFEGGLLMATLRSADEVRAADFDLDKGKLNPEMVDIAETIIERLAGKFDPGSFRDRYQDALKELIEAKSKGIPLKASQPARTASNVVDLMAALKSSLGETTTETRKATKKKPAAESKDRRQGNILLPVKGGAAGSSVQTAEVHKLPRRKAR